MHDLLSEIQEIFSQCVSTIQNLIITRESNASTVEDWDSLAHVNLVTRHRKKNTRSGFALGGVARIEECGETSSTLLEKKIATK